MGAPNDCATPIALPYPHGVANCQGTSDVSPSGPSPKRWPTQVMRPTTADNQDVCVCPCQTVEGVGATATTRPIASDDVSGPTAGRPIANFGGSRLPGRYAMTPTAPETLGEIGPRAPRNFGKLQHVLESLASATAEHGQGTMQMTPHVTRTRLPHYDEVAVPRERPPPFENDGSTPSSD